MPALSMEDMMEAGIFDATNNTRKRIYMLMKMAEDNCKVITLDMGLMESLKRD